LPRTGQDDGDENDDDDDDDDGVEAAWINLGSDRIGSSSSWKGPSFCQAKRSFRKLNRGVAAAAAAAAAVDVDASADRGPVFCALRNSTTSIVLRAVWKILFPWRSFVPRCVGVIEFYLKMYTQIDSLRDTARQVYSNK
jgi:hypothetical protein